MSHEKNCAVKCNYIYSPLSLTKSRVTLFYIILSRSIHIMHIAIKHSTQSTSKKFFFVVVKAADCMKCSSHLIAFQSNGCLAKFFFFFFFRSTLSHRFRLSHPFSVRKRYFQTEKRLPASGECDECTSEILFPKFDCVRELERIY